MVEGYYPEEDMYNDERTRSPAVGNIDPVAGEGLCIKHGDWASVHGGSITNIEIDEEMHWNGDFVCGRCVSIEVLNEMIGDMPYRKT